MSTKTEIFYERCTITNIGTPIQCPLCKTVVKSGHTHYCENKKVVRKPRRGK